MLYWLTKKIRDRKLKPTEFESLASQVQASLTTWHTYYAALPPNFPFQGTTILKEVLDEAVQEILNLFLELTRREDIDPLIYYSQRTSVMNTLNTIFQVLSAITSQPIPYMEQLFTQIWALKTMLVWLAPAQMKAEYSSLAVDFPNAEASIVAMRKELLKSVGEVKSSLFDVTAIQVEITRLSEIIKGQERETGNAKINVDANASIVAAQKQYSETKISEIDQGLIQQRKLLGLITDLQVQAALVLESAGQVGLANSFAARRKSLSWSLRLWQASFAFGIIILVVGSYFTNSDNHLPPMFSKDGLIEPWGIAARFLLAGPVVWFTWFASRQHGHVMKLIEDYAFKEAGALAYLGYKREMGTDEEMLKLLRESAIRNFGSSPTRMLMKDEPSSPLQEMLNKVIATGNFEKITEFVKAFGKK